MARYDVVIIGAGLGGLTAGAILAREGRKVLVVERGNSVGGAASSYKVGDLFIEASLHKTSGPLDTRDPKHRALTRAGVLDKVEWVPTGPLYEVRGGPVGAPFVLPDGFDAAANVLTQRFPDARDGIRSVLDDMAEIAGAMGTLAASDRAPGNLHEALGALQAKLPQIGDWDLSLSAKFEKAFGRNEAVKCALAGNLWYYHDDAAALWWPFFAASQGQFLQSGGCYVKTGSQRLSSALARAIKAAGSDVILRRVVTGITMNDGGSGHLVTHEAKAGGDPQQVEAERVISNAAPAVAAGLMSGTHGERLLQSYAEVPSSISLFALTLGLSRRPDEIGLSAYSTQVLPDDMTSLNDYARGTTLFSGEPDGRIPPLAIVNYAAIDSGVPTSPYIISIVGADRLSNWSGMERPAYTARRARWQEAIVASLDRIYPGFAEAIVASSFNTANSMVGYLNAPNGAAYGFAPVLPRNGQSPRSPRTVIDGFYLASAYAGFGGYTGAIQAGSACADAILTA